MTTNLTRAVEREVHIAYAHGKDAGSPTGSLPTEDQVVEVATDMIMGYVREWYLSSPVVRMGLEMAVLKSQAGVQKGSE